MKELKYTSSIKDMPLMFLEMKKTAILLCEGKTDQEILSMSIEENIYQLDKEKRRRDTSLKMLKRLSTLRMPLIKKIVDGTTDEGKLIAFIALMKSDRLVHEYMLDVYADKADEDEINDSEFMQFIDRLAANSETAANWKSDTLKNINTKLKNILCDTGLAKRTKTALTVIKPYVDSEFLSILDGDDWVYAKAVLKEGGI